MFGKPVVERLQTAVKLRKITPNDTEDLDFVPRALIVGTGGTITVIAVGDDEPVTIPVPDFGRLDIQVRRVLAEGTDADPIIGLL